MNTLDTGTKEFRRSESWHWSVQWEGWFTAAGSASGKQEAADRATAAWWQHIANPLPRNVELEIDMIIARILVMPPPNSLMGESAPYLRQMQRSLTLLYERELKAETLPPQVKNLMANLSAELYARRLAGKAEDDVPSNWGVT
ncbi:MAG: hypothetical protein WBA73_14345 [Devosia sp.]